MKVRDILKRLQSMDPDTEIWSLEDIPNVCMCGSLRREVVSHQDDPFFYPRRGCLTCNKWDGPPVLKSRQKVS